MKKIAVVGQGYVGLPLSIAFADHYPVVGFDIDKERITALKAGFDSTFEVTEVYNELKQYGMNIDVMDTWAEKAVVQSRFHIDLKTSVDELGQYDGIIAAVGHREFAHIDWAKIMHQDTVVYDLKNIVNRSLADGRL